MSTPSYLRYANQGATRNQPLDPRLVSSLAFLGDMGITAEVYSGGQPGKGSGGKRVGSTRHDHGNAADVRFYKGDRLLNFESAGDRPVFEDIVRRGRAAGITGMGAAVDYMGPTSMHVGFGSPGVWGAGGRSATAPDWLRNAYNGAPAGSAPMALGPEPSPSGAASAIQSVMADRSAPSPSPTGGSMAAPSVSIGPKKSSKVQEAMLAQALANGGNSRHPLELVGNLAQVWAANRGIKANEASEASALQQAMAGANLDPAYALAAQLGGDRESLAGAIMSQQSDRTQAAQRAEDQAWRQDERGYQRQRDQVGDQQWQAEQERLSQGTLPAGYRRTATGLEAIPGGPADPAGAGAGGGDLGLNPQYGVDAEGNPVLLQLGKNGTVVQSQMPDGVSLAKEPIRLDAGTHFVLLDPITRQPVGQVPKDNYQEGYQNAAGTAQGKSDVERANDAPKSIQQADNMLASIDGVLNDPNLSWAVGAGSMIPAIPGTSIPGTRARIDQLGGQAFLQAFESLKGGGQITEIEGQKATQAIARLNTAQSEEDFRAALMELRGIVEGAKARAQGIQAPQVGAQQFDSGVPVGGNGAPPVDYRGRYGLE